MTNITKISQITDGDQLSQGYFNETFNLLATNILANATKASTTLIQGIASATINTSTTTAKLVGSYYRPGGKLYDDYEDSSIDTSKNTVSTTGSGSETKEETGGYGHVARVYAPGSGDNTVTATWELTHDFSTSAGQTICIFDADITSSKGGSLAGSSQTIAVRLGGVDLWSSTSSSDISLSSGRSTWYLILNTAKTSCDVYKDSTFVATVDVSGKSDAKFECYATSRENNVSVDIKVYETRYVDDSCTYTDTIYFINNPTILNTYTKAFTSAYDTLSGNTTRTPCASFNGGSNYSSLTHRNLSTVSVAGTSLLLKLEYGLANSGDDFFFTNLSCLYG